MVSEEHLGHRLRPFGCQSLEFHSRTIYSSIPPFGTSVTPDIMLGAKQLVGETKGPSPSPHGGFILAEEADANQMGMICCVVIAETNVTTGSPPWICHRRIREALLSMGSWS